MKKITMELQRVHKNGTPAIRLIVRNANAELREICEVLGILPDNTLANFRSITCSSPAELDLARKPLLSRVVGAPDANGLVELR